VFTSRSEAILFFSVWFSCVFFSDFYLFETNYASRFYLTKAIVENHTVEVTPYIKEIGVDKAKYKNRYYIPRPVASSLLMVPQYVVTKPLAHALVASRFGSTWPFGVDCMHAFLVKALSSCLFCALAVVLFARLLSRFMDERFSSFAALAFFLTTNMFPESTEGVGESFTTVFVLAGFHLLLPFRKRTGFPSLAGLAFAIATLVSPQAILAAGGALVYLAIRRQAAGILRFVPWIVLAVFLTLLSNRVIFDHWLSFPVDFWAPDAANLEPTVRGKSRMLLEIPTAGKLYQMLFSPYRGIFFYSPFLLFALPGARRLLREHPAESAAFLASFLVVFLFFLVTAGWAGGWDFGWRYILIVLPFLGLFAWYDAYRCRIRFLRWAFLAWGGIVTSFGVLGSPQETRYGVDTSPIFGAWMPALLKFGPFNIVTDLYKYVLGRGRDLTLAWASSLAVLAGIWALCLWLGRRASRHGKAPGDLRFPSGDGSRTEAAAGTAGPAHFGGIS
jgi:MFS family permease